MKATTTKTTTVTQRFAVEFKTEESLEAALVTAAKNALRNSGKGIAADIPDSDFKVSFDVSSGGYLRGALVSIELTTTTEQE